MKNKPLRTLIIDDEPDCVAVVEMLFICNKIVHYTIKRITPGNCIEPVRKYPIDNIYTVCYRFFLPHYGSVYFIYWVISGVVAPYKKCFGDYAHAVKRYSTRCGYCFATQIRICRRLRLYRNHCEQWKSKHYNISEENQSVKLLVNISDHKSSRVAG